MADGGVPGIEDASRLGRWLAENGVPGDQGHPPRATLIAGGRSNLTYLLDVGLPPGSAEVTLLVLRRPPLGHVLPTAHDMAREYRLLSALYGTEIPVPRPVAICPDPAVIGAPFYVMEHVAGLVIRTREDGAQVSPAQAHQLSLRFADMLAAIHGVDLAAVGLTGFGRPEGYLERQLTRWQRQWELSQTREMPGYEQLTARLAAGLPAAGSDGTLVHGDYRLDNMLIALDSPPAGSPPLGSPPLGSPPPGSPPPGSPPPGSPPLGSPPPGSPPMITAVLDWEMSTLGDPLADLGLALVYWADADDDESMQLSVGSSVTAGPGFLSRLQVAERYAALTGRDVSRIGYYMAFGCFKLAVVLEGIHARFLQHKTVGEGFEQEGPAVPLLIQRAHRLLDSASDSAR
jgi:aminoglycoside phosphotransferase (APT) family kinase protein